MQFIKIYKLNHYFYFIKIFFRSNLFTKWIIRKKEWKIKGKREGRKKIASWNSEALNITKWSNSRFFFITIKFSIQVGDWERERERKREREIDRKETREKERDKDWERETKIERDREREWEIRRNITP